MAPVALDGARGRRRTQGTVRSKADRWCLQGIFFFLSFLTGSGKRTSGLRAFASADDPELRPPLLEWRSNSTPALTSPNVLRRRKDEVLECEDAQPRLDQNEMFQGRGDLQIPRIPRDMTSDFSALMFS